MSKLHAIRWLLAGSIALALIGTAGILFDLAEPGIDGGVSWGLKDRVGRVVLAARYAKIEPLQAGLYRLVANIDGAMRYGLADAAGRVVLEPRYRKIEAVEGADVLLVCEERCGLVKRDGAIAAPFQFTKIETVGEGPYPSYRGEDFAYLGADGTVHAEGRFDRGEPFYHGVAWVELEGRPVQINRKFETVLGRLRQLADVSGERCADGSLRQPLYLTGAPGKPLKWGVTDESGRQVVPAVYDSVVARGGCILVRQADHWGAVSRSGAWLLEPKCDDIFVTPNALVYAVSKKWGAYSLTERRELLPPRYDSLTPTRRADRWIARNGDAAGLIDDRGQPVGPQTFESIDGRWSSDAFVYRTSFGGGIADLDGRTVYGPELGQGSYLKHHSEWFRDPANGVSAFAVESAAHRLGRWASVLYDDHAPAILYALLGAMILLGWWLALKGGAASVLGQNGRILRYLGSLLLVAFAEIYIGYLIVPDRVRYASKAVEAWLNGIFLAILVAGIAPYLHRRWRAWQASSRWFFVAISWPVTVLAVMVLLDQLGFEAIANAVAGWWGIVALSWGLGLLVYAGRSVRDALSPWRWGLAGLLRRALRTMAIVTCMVVALFALALLWYSFDEDLSPGAKEVLDHQPKLGANTPDNGYVAFIGIGAPRGADPLAWGGKAIQAYQEADRKGETDSRARPELGEELKLSDKAWRDPDKQGKGKSVPLLPWCEPEVRACLPIARRRGAEIEALLEDNSEFLARYKLARGKRQFRQAYWGSRIDSITPPYYRLVQGQRLVLLDLSRRAAKRAGLRPVLYELEQETEFHRRVAAGSVDFLGKAIATTLLARDFLIYSEILAAKKGSIAPGQLPGASIAGTVGVGTDLSEAVAAEGVQTARILQTRDPGHPYKLMGADLSAAGAVVAALYPLSRFAYRPNAMLNDVARLLLQEREKAALPAQAFAGYTRSKQSDSAFTWRELARNPFAALVMGGVRSWSPELGSDLATRMHDLEGLRRLVALQELLVKAKAMTPEKIQSVLSSKAALGLSDPYTGEPMRFDPASRRLSFEARGRAVFSEKLRNRFDGRIAVRL